MKTKGFLSQIMLASLILFASCGSKEQKEAQAKEEAAEEIVKVKVEKASEQEVDQLSTFTATIEADVVNHISPSTPMRIKKIYVDVGSNVSKGQKLVDMDATNLAQQEAQLLNYQKDYQRIKDLFEVGGASQQQLDQIKLQYDVAKQTVQRIKDDTQLVSPISGIVTAKNYDEGDVYAQQPVLTVQQMNPVKALVNVSESYYSKVKTGMTVEIKLDVYGNEVFEGKVSKIYPVIDAATHTFTVEITIANKNLRVRPGMFARVTFNFGKENRVVLPDNAIIKQPGSNDRFVYIVENGKAIYTKVELGQRLGGTYELISGVQPGAEVVIAGQSRLVSGTKVEVVGEEAMTKEFNQ